MKSKLRSKAKQSRKTHTAYGLTERELEILNLMVEGLTKKQIGESLSLSYHTIDSHIRKIYKKMDVKSKIFAITKAIKENITK
jgi:two-component system, NarL family, nitrate/nitrite response regulator NarL